MKPKPKQERRFHDQRKIERGEHHSRPPSNIIYGVLPVTEAIRARNRRIDKILIAEGSRESRLNQIVELARESRVTINFAPKTSLDKQAGEGKNHQGVIAFTAAAEYADVDELLSTIDSDTLLLVLDGVEDPQNLGAALRSAECAGVSGVIIPERRAAGLTETVAKASAGAIEYAKVAKVPNLNRLIEELKDKNVWVVGTDGDAEMNYTEWDWTRPSAIVMGSEGRGLHRLVAENCDVLVKIPMYGKIKSLNVSAATSVILFEARRQREESIRTRNNVLP
jgi:23S rRNA (guanosine2251-2'-O)-methyltransferase